MNQSYKKDDLIFTFKAFSDERGDLTIADANPNGNFPFEIRRVFWISGVPKGQTRGTHAHQWCSEALAAVHGRFKVKVDTGQGEPFVVELSSPGQGLLIPPLVWCELFDFSSDAVCLCLASGGYDEEGYLKDYDAFVRFVK